MKQRFLNRKPTKRKFPNISTLFWTFRDQARVARILDLPTPEFAQKILDNHSPRMNLMYGLTLRYVREKKEKENEK